MYLQTDLKDDPLSEPVYGYELRKAKDLKDIEFRIERVLDERVKNGVHESYVKYLFYPDKFNDWIPTSSIRSGKNAIKKKLEKKVNSVQPQ